MKFPLSGVVHSAANGFAGFISRIPIGITALPTRVRAKLAVAATLTEERWPSALRILSPPKTIHVLIVGPPVGTGTVSHPMLRAARQPPVAAEELGESPLARYDLAQTVISRAGSGLLSRSSREFRTAIQ